MKDSKKEQLHITDPECKGLAEDNAGLGYVQLQEGFTGWVAGNNQAAEQAGITQHSWQLSSR